MAAADPHFRLRIPEDLKARIERSAEENGRSINAEIVYRLKGSFGVEASELDALDRRIRELEAEKRAARDARDVMDARIEAASRLLEAAWRDREEMRDLESRRQDPPAMVRKIAG